MGGLMPSKYRAVRTTVDGVTFASRAEANRWQELRLLERAGHIADLEYQPRYPLRVNGIVVATYVADSRYRDVLRDRLVVEDVKGVRTPVYRLKKKLMRACHGIDITEVSA
jgi:hypothetical protein